ncbi:MAG: HlyD family efflux transporter periplasmic adaptor subunit [Dermatophilaceae bacterium]
MSRTRVMAGTGAAVLAMGGVAAAVLLTSGPDSTAAAPAAEAAEATGTATVERRDLVTTEELTGELGFGEPTSVGAAASGVVTSVPEDGATVKVGDTLFEVDAEPVVLLSGAVPAYRDLADGVEGADVEQLEKALRDLGYGDDVTVDREYTAATADAVQTWEEKLGRDDPDGVVQLGEVRFGSGAVRVDEVAADVGTQVQAGTAVLQVTATTKVVVAALDADRAGDLAAGTTAQVELPGGVETTGTVSTVGTEVEENTENPEAEPTVDVTVTLDDAAGVAEVDTGDATVTVERSRTEGALAVPVTALLALAGGGYAVEVRSGGGSELVAVDIGTVADAWVEVDGVAEGSTVAVAE